MRWSSITGHRLNVSHIRIDLHAASMLELHALGV